MKHFVSKAYIVLLAICLVVGLYVLNEFRLDVTQRQSKGGYEEVTAYRYQLFENVDAPLGVREEYIFRFDEIGGSYRDLVFYTIHQNVDVYVGQDRVYRIRPYVYNDFGKTPGCVWNRVAMENGESSTFVRVVVYPVYESSIGVIPKFYFGEEHDIAMSIIMKQLPAMLICLACMLVGLLFAAYALFNSRHTEKDNSLVMLGCFAVIISLWKITDNEAIYMLFPNVQGIYFIPFLTLHLASIPFTIFVRELHVTNRSNKLWYVPMVISVLGLMTTLFLQFAKIMDMRETLWVIHVELLVAVVVIFAMVIREIRSRGMSKQMKQNLIFLLLCVAGMMTDMVVYYLTSGMVGTLAGILCFIIYICVLGTRSMKDAKALMDFGLQAKKFEQKAYHDQLTGLGNRTAYADYTTNENFSPERCIVAMFDLNNLKKCNDTLGHEKGDIYIKECANMIKETFQDIGHCYRMGGDEFCAILENVSLEICKKRMALLQEAVLERNRKNPEIKMGIAYGYEMYDKRIDYDINDTSRRADKMMYHEKYTMKQLAAMEVNSGGK